MHVARYSIPVKNSFIYLKEIAELLQYGNTVMVSVLLSSDHIDYIKTVAGINHVGVGSDFDGIDLYDMIYTG